MSEFEALVGPTGGGAASSLLSAVCPGLLVQAWNTFGPDSYLGRSHRANDTLDQSANRNEPQDGENSSQGPVGNSTHSKAKKLRSVREVPRSSRDNGRKYIRT
jgi:hypothetical protein